MKLYRKLLKVLFDGQVEKLKVEECKIYLRRHVLRLSGTKDVLIQRIKEHVDIVNGGGEKKYPASSFVLNCKGDACRGDVVMFEQNMYGIANGPPCGTRVVAGRIVKESYGAAKQQHTFTIEVLWSKGEKRLPPLHPLLIKGRNLYRLKTMRQKWDDEGERQKILSEKHARGGVARCNREARIQQREMRKIRKQNRATRKQRPNRKQEEEKQDPLHSVSVKPENLTIQAKQRQQDPKNTQKQQSCKQKINSYPRTCGLNIPIQLNSVSKAHVPLQGHLQRQPLISMNCSFPRDQHINSQFSNFDSLRSTRGGFHEEQHKNYNRMRKTLCGFDENRHRSQSQQSHLYHRQDLNAARNPAFQRKQTCRYYVQGRCRFGNRCKYLHELARNGV